MHISKADIDGRRGVARPNGEYVLTDEWVPLTKAPEYIVCA